MLEIYLTVLGCIFLTGITLIVVFGFIDFAIDVWQKVVRSSHLWKKEKER